MKTNYDKVKEFHIAFNHPVSDSVKSIERGRAFIRFKWMEEELSEFMHSGTIAGELDAMIDLQYFLYGTLAEMGIPESLFNHCFEIVHQANMSKLHYGKPVYNADNKVIKPEGWVSPDQQISIEIEKYRNEQDTREEE